jgi:hypothetical protein
MFHEFFLRLSVQLFDLDPPEKHIVCVCGGKTLRQRFARTLLTRHNIALEQQRQKRMLREAEADAV